MKCMLDGCPNKAGPFFSFRITPEAKLNEFAWCSTCFEMYIKPVIKELSK